MGWKATLKNTKSGGGQKPNKKPKEKEGKKNGQGGDELKFPV